MRQKKKNFFSISGKCDSTRALQSSLILGVKIWKKYWKSKKKNTFLSESLEKYFFMAKKKLILLVLPLKRLVFDQSSGRIAFSWYWETIFFCLIFFFNFWFFLCFQVNLWDFLRLLDFCDNFWHFFGFWFFLWFFFNLFKKKLCFSFCFF